MTFLSKLKKRPVSPPHMSKSTSEIPDVKSNLSPPLKERTRSNTVFTMKEPVEKQMPQEGQTSRARSDSCDSGPFISSFRDELYETMKDKEAEVSRLRAWLPILNGDSSTSKRESSTKLQFLIRKGVPDLLRQQVWKAVSGTSDFMEENTNFYNSMMLLVFGPKIPTTLRHVPSFGGVISPSDHYLSNSVVIKRLLCVLAISFPEIDYCPSLPDIVIMSLMFLSESDATAMLHIMLDTAKTNPRYYFNTSVRELTQSTLTFDRLISRHLWPIHKHISRLGIDAAKSIAEPWFTRMFVSYLPYQTVLRIFDIYVNEGSKILFKTGLAILSLLSRKLLKTSTKHEFEATLHRAALKLHDADLLIKTAYGIRMKCHIVHHLDKKAIQIIESITEPLQPVYYRPKTPLVSSTILDEQFEILWSWVPRRFCIQDPVLIFSTDIHGCSLSTFYHMCSNVSPSILAIRTKSGSIFGAYLSDPWVAVNKQSNPVYYGDGECFVFSLSPTTHHWPWTGENEYFMVAANDHIAVGGGSGCSLWLNHSFDFCMSSSSETFRNPPLELSSEFLGAVTVEVFGFQ